MRVAALTHLWWGVSIGGKHYTGEIHYDGPTVELTRKLGLKEAKQMAEDEDRLWLPLERETNRFNTLKQLERYATKWCEKNLGDEWLLIHVDSHNPHRPIAGKGKIVPVLPAMTEVAEFWDKLTDTQREVVWDEIYTIWRNLLKVGD